MTNKAGDGCKCIRGGDHERHSAETWAALNKRGMGLVVCRGFRDSDNRAAGPGRTICYGVDRCTILESGARSSKIEAPGSKLDNKGIHRNAEAADCCSPQGFAANFTRRPISQRGKGANAIIILVATSFPRFDRRWQGGTDRPKVVKEKRRIPASRRFSCIACSRIRNLSGPWHCRLAATAASGGGGSGWEGLAWTGVGG